MTISISTEAVVLPSPSSALIFMGHGPETINLHLKMKTNTIVAMAAFLLACAAETASAAPDPPRRPGSATAHPCARISASWAEQKKKTTTAGESELYSIVFRSL